MLFILMLCTFGCSNLNTDVTTKINMPVWADFTGAQGVFIDTTSDRTLRSTSTRGNAYGHLKKIKSDGSFEDVTYKDENDDSINTSSFEAYSITQLDDTWIIVKYGDYGSDMPIEAQLVLINIETGNVYSLANSGLLEAIKYVEDLGSSDENGKIIGSLNLDMYQPYGDSWGVYSDSTGGFYLTVSSEFYWYLPHGEVEGITNPPYQDWTLSSGVIRVDVSNSPVITQQTVYDTSDASSPQLLLFAADYWGNVFLPVYTEGSQETIPLLKNSAGALSELSFGSDIEIGREHAVFVSPDKIIHLIIDQGWGLGGGVTPMYRITQFGEVESIGSAADLEGIEGDILEVDGNVFSFGIKDSLIYAGEESVFLYTLFDSNDGAVPRAHELDDGTISAIEYSSPVTAMNSIYLRIKDRNSNSNMLIEYNWVNDTMTEIDVSHIIISEITGSQDKLIIQGLRLSDSKLVMITIDNSNNIVSEVEIGGSTEVTNLILLN